MPHPKVLVIYNEPVLSADHPDAASERDIIDVAAAITQILVDAGFPTRCISFNHDPGTLLAELRESPPDVVFNLFEGLATNNLTEIAVAGLLEWLGLPFTGSPSFAIALGRDKVRTKYLLQGAGLPTPAFLVVDKGPCPRWPHAWPAIVKPACQDASLGIEQASVVTEQAQLQERVVHVLERFGPPVLVEQFIFGREFHATFIEDPGESPLHPQLTPLPLGEIRFEYKPGAPYWPIYSYAAKWEEEAEEYLSTPMTMAEVSPELAERVTRVGRQAFRLAGMRDYGRVDFRVPAEGEPYVIEVNPNPYLGSVSVLSGLQAIGRSYPQLIVDIVWAALGRVAKAVVKPARRRAAGQTRKARTRGRSATGDR